MKPSEALSAHRGDIRRIVGQNRTCNPRVFGSVLRGEDANDSDLDLLVDPLPGVTLLILAHSRSNWSKFSACPLIC